MLSIEEITKKLRDSLSEKRFLHSIRVSKTAVDMAHRYNADEVRAEIAGLIHDCARDIPEDVQLKMAGDFGILLDEIERREKALIHGSLGAEIARRFYGITDEAVLRAVRLHTTGDADMNLLDKIIYLSDYIEPGRDFPGVERLRTEAYRNLDEAVLLALNSTIKYVVEKRALLHPRTVTARNFILLFREREEKS